MTRRVNNACNCSSLEEPCDENPVEPVSSLLASVLELLLCLPGQESFLLAVDFVLASVEVGLVGFDALGLHEEFVAEDANEVDWDTL